MDDVDISGQPSGTDIVWKITTHNAKEQRIYNTYNFWRVVA